MYEELGFSYFGDGFDGYVNPADEEALEDLILELCEYEDKMYPEARKYSAFEKEEFERVSYSRWAIEHYIDLLVDIPFFAPMETLAKFTWEMYKSYEMSKTDRAKKQFGAALEIIKDIEAFITTGAECQS